MLTWSVGLIILIGWGLLIYTYRHQINALVQQMRVDVECAPLRQKLLKIVSQDTAERLIALAKRKNPGKLERWYLEKVLYDLQRRR
ncbi:hypothetical protein NIES4071_66210 [Calothrix sp. NIES-4071]|nr:hypothetical protein NIES4071_66210 [Calothrix sp. NIES-4071]BAZ60925.1 hypothetical protein NIES4105_66170 [Calothrix sp. NIES-4105]